MITDASGGVWQEFGPNGLVCNIAVGLTAAAQEEFRQAGLPVPAPFTIPAMVDTGTTRTFFSPAVMARLQAKPTGTKLKTYGSTKEVQHLDEYKILVCVPFTGGGGRGLNFLEWFCSVGELSFGSAERPYEAVIGLDVLVHCRLVVDGPTHSFQLVERDLSKQAK